MFERGDAPAKLRARHRQDAQAFGRHARGGRLDRRPVERAFVAVAVEHRRAGGQDLLHRSLEVDDALAFDLVRRRHVLARRVEGQRIDAREDRVQGRVVEPALVRHDQERRLGRVSDDLPDGRIPPGFVAAQELRIVAEDAGDQGLAQRAADRCRVPARRCRTGRRGGRLDAAGTGVAGTADGERLAARPQLAYGHRVLGQRPGLVGADDGRAAERLDRRQLADDRAPFRHARDADRQGHRHRRRQPLGNRADRERDRRHEHVDHRFAAGDADDEGEDGQRQDRHQQALREGADLARQRRRHVRRLGDQLRDATGLGLVAGGDDDAGAGAGDDQRSRVGHVLAVGEQGIDRQRVGILEYRRRLAGQRRLGGGEFAAVEEAQVGRNLVAGGEDDHVAGNEFDRIDAALDAAAQHGRLGGNGAAERGERGLGLAFLDEAEHGIDEDDAEDHAGIDPLAEEGGHRTRHDQHQHQRLCELRDEAGKRSGTRTLPRLVRAPALQAAGRLGLVESARRIDPDVVSHPLQFMRMPVLHRRLP